MDREIAPQEYKWNLNDIFKNMEEFEKNFKKIEKNYGFFANFKGKLHIFDEILKYFQFCDEFETDLERVNSYIFLNHDIDTNNNLFIELNERFNMFISKLSEVTAYILPELASLSDEFYEQLLKDKRFSNYRYKIESIIDNRKFVLSEKEEQALSIISKFSNGYEEVYESLTQTDMKFEPVEIDGKLETLTQSTYGKFIECKDRNVRTQAYNNLYKTFNQFSKTLALNYINFAKMVNSDVDLRKQKTTFNAIFHSKKIDEKLLEKLIYNVNQNIELEHKYFTLLKSSLNVEDFGFQDIYQSLSKNIEKKWNIEEQKNIVLLALKPLGEEYTSMLEQAYQNNWIDFCTNINKKSGGYMLGVYGVHPYILLNDNGGYDSLTTLAHELGHAMHTHYSDTNQPYSTHQYETFIAEIASTVNEILLNKYMQQNAKSNEEKLFYVNQYIQTFKGTVFRQTMFEEFENFAYKKIENNEILSPEILDGKYRELLEKHFSNIVKIDENIVHEWLRIPHFYSPYYVYQYSTSFVAAVFIANNILNGNEDMLNKYIEMLKSGSNGYPLEILKKAGVDLTNDDTYSFAFDDLKKSLELAEKLL